jgi:GWxTD domain-containing protein
MNKLLIVILLLFSYTLSAQIDKSNYYSFGKELYSEVDELPYSSPDSARVVVLVKAATEALHFQKVNDGVHFGQFAGVLSAEITFQHESGIIKFRKKLSDTVYLNDYSQTLSKSLYLEGFADVVLAREKYRVEVKFETKESHFENHQKHEFDCTQKPEFYTPLMFNTNREELFTDLQPFILDGRISFDAQSAKVLIPANDLGDDNYTYTLRKEKSISNSSIEWDKENIVNGICEKIDKVDFRFINTNSNVTFDLKRNSNYSVLSIDLPGVKVIPGVYDLAISKNNKEVKNYEISIEWVNQPISLNKIDYAIEILKYVATQSEIDSISGADDVPAAFFNYWKAKDPTPSTPFNEALQQYYARVDYAFFNYKTISEDDGAMTDRGKIYILKAAPEEVEEKYIDNRTLVVWKYPKQKKEYVFELIVAGDYRLIKINDIEG